MINIIFSEEYKNHDTGNHPEAIKRIEVVNNLIKEEYLKHNFIEPTIAEKQMILLVHDTEYVNYIFESIPTSGLIHFDPDTVACPNSLNSYLLAVGGSVDAVNYIINNKNNQFFLLVTKDATIKSVNTEKLELLVELQPQPPTNSLLSSSMLTHFL